MAARRPRRRLYAIGVYFQNAVRRNAGLYRVYHAELLDDDAYCALQMTLLLQPQAGPVIRGTGGLRKLRWSLKGIGKRGGIRVIYYWDKATETFYMLYAFRKSEREDLSVPRLRVLSRLVREEFG